MSMQSGNSPLSLDDSYFVYLKYAELWMLKLIYINCLEEQTPFKLGDR